MLLAASRRHQRFVQAGSRVVWTRRLQPAQRDLSLALRSRGRTLASTRSGLTLRERATRTPSAAASTASRRAPRAVVDPAARWSIPLVVLGGVLFASGREIGSIEYANDPGPKKGSSSRPSYLAFGGVRSLNSVDGEKFPSPRCLQQTGRSASRRASGPSSRAVSRARANLMQEAPREGEG